MKRFLRKTITLIALLFYIAAINGCSTFTPQRYSLSADTNVALKALGHGNINVGPFTMGDFEFNQNCRGAGPIAPPDNLSFEEYIRKAFSDELKVAGLFDDQTTTVTLRGQVVRLDFSSSKGLTGGYWDIALRIYSTNGKSIEVSEYYEFKSGFDGMTACKQTAEAYLPAVQDLLIKLVTSKDFPALIATQAL